MTDIPSLARTRALWAARYEAISSEISSRDPVERAAQDQAYREALAAYRKAEDEYARAVSTLSPAELELILVQGRAAA